MSYQYFPRRYKDVGYHNCVVTTTDHWPRLKPRANLCERCCRKIRDATLPSYSHPQSKYKFGSFHTFRAEKIRMIYHCNPFMIHPYSPLAVARDIIMCHVYVISFFCVLFLSFFDSLPKHAVSLSIITIVKIFQLLYILSNFMFGYTRTVREQTSIVLDGREMAKHYLKTYFAFDIIDLSSPFLLLFGYNIYAVWINLVLVHIAFIARLGTIYSYMKTTLQTMYRVQGKHRHLFTFTISIIAYVHYMTCLMYGLPKLIDITLGAPIGKYFQETATEKLAVYMICVHKVFLLFYRCGSPSSVSRFRGETLSNTFILICSYFVNVYIFVFVLMTIKKMNHAENKYSFMWHNIFNYMKSRNISGKLRYKIMAHYEYRFQYKYFDEAFIITSLSDHLQYELLLQTCSHLIINVTILRGLPKTVIGRIIAALQPVFFLPNDIIMKCQTNSECVYFISYGTVAFYTYRGKEVYHTEDGSVLGVTAFLTGTNSFNCIAVTITELYKWDIRDIYRVIKISPELGTRLKVLGKARMTESDNVDMLFSNAFNLKDVLEERIVIREESAEHLY